MYETGKTLRGTVNIPFSGYLELCTESGALACSASAMAGSVDEVVIVNFDEGPYTVAFPGGSPQSCDSFLCTGPVVTSDGPGPIPTVSVTAPDGKVATCPLTP